MIITTRPVYSVLRKAMQETVYLVFLNRKSTVCACRKVFSCSNRENWKNSLLKDTQIALVQE